MAGCSCVGTGLRPVPAGHSPASTQYVRELTCRIEPYTHGNFHSGGREERRNTGKAPSVTPNHPPVALRSPLLVASSRVGSADGAGGTVGCRPGFAHRPDF